MNLWQCPKCGWHTHQPAYVTDVKHRCRPAIPRLTRLVQVPQPNPSESRGTSNAHR